MNIEVYKTSIKLTKSIVNQLREAGLDVLKNGKVLGYVINVRKDVHRALLISYNDELYYIADDWSSFGKSTKLYRKRGKWTIEWDFQTAEQKEVFMTEYEKILQTTLPQIFV